MKYIVLLAALACLGWLSMGCQPLKPQQVVNCGNTQAPLQSGLLDVGTRDTYGLQLNIPYSLGDIQLMEASVWLEYPEDFSRKMLGSALLRTKESPYRVVMGAFSTREAPGLQLSVNVIPSHLTSIFTQVSELRTGSKRFTVKIHVEFKGDVEIPPLVFPLEVCKGCLANAEMPDCKNKVTPDKQGQHGMHCIGQDWTCLSK